jgi:hypothetical protein
MERNTPLGRPVTKKGERPNKFIALEEGDSQTGAPTRKLTKSNTRGIRLGTFAIGPNVGYLNYPFRLGNATKIRLRTKPARLGQRPARRPMRRLNLGAIEASPTINASSSLLRRFSPLLEVYVGPAGSRDIWPTDLSIVASKCTSAGQSEQHDGDWEAAHPLQEGSEATAQETHAT